MCCARDLKKKIFTVDNAVLLHAEKIPLDMEREILNNCGI